MFLLVSGAQLRTASLAGHASGAETGRKRTNRMLKKIGGRELRSKEHAYVFLKIPMVRV